MRFDFFAKGGLTRRATAGSIDPKLDRCQTDSRLRVRSPIASRKHVDRPPDGLQQLSDSDEQRIPPGDSRRPVKPPAGAKPARLVGPNGRVQAGSWFGRADLRTLPGEIAEAARRFDES